MSAVSLIKEKEFESRGVERPVLFRIVIPENIVAEALQSEVAISSSTDSRPIVASYGAGPCVIIGGYEPKQKVAFIAHVSHAGEVASDGLKIISIMKKVLKNPGKFQLVLKGGIKNHSDSEKTLKEIDRWVRITNSVFYDVQLQIKESDCLDSENDPSKSLAIDSRDGSMREYDPLKDNPFHYRKVTMEDILHAKKSYKAPALKILHSLPV